MLALRVKLFLVKPVDQNFNSENLFVNRRQVSNLSHLLRKLHHSFTFAVDLPNTGCQFGPILLVLGRLVFYGVVSFLTFRSLPIDREHSESELKHLGVSRVGERHFEIGVSSHEDFLTAQVWDC